MQLKYKEHVFFLNNLSVEEELKLINTTNEQDKNYTKLPTGSLSLSEICPKSTLDFIDLKSEQTNENCFYLSLMLLSAPSFSTFVENIVESSTKIPPIINNFHKIITAIKNKKTIPIEDLIPFTGCTDIVEGYQFILSVIHEQLLSHFYFKEDSWIVPNKEKSIKPIFPASSPVTNMFHGKLVKNVGEIKSGYFDVLKNCSHQTVLNMFRSKDLLNRPSVVLIETDSIFKETPDGYIVSAVLAGESYVLYIYSNRKWFKYTREGMTISETIGDVSDIKYVLLSRVTEQ